MLFQWDSLDHVPAARRLPADATRERPGDPYDYFHINSVAARPRWQPASISARNTWAVYKVDHHTGGVMWTLGGKHSSFKLGPGASFAFQHDVRVLAAPITCSRVRQRRRAADVHSQSRALTLRLNFKHMTATAGRRSDRALAAAACCLRGQ